MRDIAASELDAAELAGLVSPSLFGDRRVVVIRGGQDARTDLVATLTAYVADPSDTVTMVLVHSGGGRSKALLKIFREAAATEIECARLTRAEERIEFIRAEVAQAGGRIAPPAAAALLDSVGTDLRELATVCSQLVFDTGGDISLDAVQRYHRGRAEVTGFAVADRAVVGDVVGALETLRWALSVGVAHVLVADALADGIRSVARVATSGRGNPYALASALGMPPWKIKRAQSQARGWSEAGLRQALTVVAAVNADVKGVAADPSYALEQAIRKLAAARRIRA